MSSGVIAAAGPNLDSGEIGREVFGRNDWFADGATAESCLAQSSSIAPKPARLSHAEAASVPIGALTAWQGLFDRAKLQPGERILIHGASGAVGLFAVQLARRAGASVAATASSRNVAYLKQLGADAVIDYRTARFQDHAGPMDVVFDCVGGETLQRSWTVLKPGGRLVTIAANSEGTQDERTKAAFFIVEPNRPQLIEIGQLLESGELKPCLGGTVPLAEASSAYSAEQANSSGGAKW